MPSYKSSVFVFNDPELRISLMLRLSTWCLAKRDVAWTLSHYFFRVFSLLPRSGLYSKKRTVWDIHFKIKLMSRVLWKPLHEFIGDILIIILLLWWRDYDFIDAN